MRKLPLFVITSILIFVGIAYYSIQQFHFYSKDFFAESVLFKERQIKIYSQLAIKLAEQNLLDDLGNLLKDAQEQQNFDWFLLTLNGKPIWAKPEEMRDRQIAQVPGQVVINENVSYQTVKLNQELLLTIGINKRLDSYISRRYEKAWQSTVQDLFIPLMIAIGVFLFFLRDLLKLVKILKASHVKENFEQLAEIKPQSSESQVIIEGIKGFHAELTKAYSERDILYKQVLPSMRKELFSGQEPPYEFSATLVRLDINKFSEYFQNCDRNKLLECVNELFIQITILVSRHGGFIHEFIGDEVLFYFKGASETTVSSALWCLRDIDEYVNSSLSKTSIEKIGAPLRFKACLSTGDLRFGPMVDGFSLAGTILIESVRILSQQQQRENNSVLFDSRHLPLLPAEFSATEMTSVTLKGLGTQSMIYQLSQFPTPSWQNRIRLKLDHHLAENFTQAFSPKCLLSSAEYSQSIKELTQFPLYPCNDQLQSAVLTQLEDFTAGLANIEKDDAEKLATFVISLKSMKFSEERSQRLGEILVKLVEHRHTRLAANAIEVLLTLQIFEFDSLIEKLWASSEPRIIANAIVFASATAKTESWVRSLRTMLNSRHTNYRASALYAIGEIAYNWAKTDPVRLHAHTEMQALIGEVQKYSRDRNHSVRSQAFHALEKISRESTQKAA